MRTEEANKIIAEFMGWYVSERFDDLMYIEEDKVLDIEIGKCDSLDALVPVWEKMNMPKILEMDIRDPSQYAKGFGIRNYADLSYCFYEDNSHSIQEAAAIATAKAILGLKKGEL